jgi:pre-rRNA-processing protein TSR2
VAKDIVLSYEKCAQGDYQHIEVLEQMYQNLQRQPRSDVIINQPDESQEDDDDDEDDEMETDENGDGDHQGAMEVETSQNIGPIIDEEGFELVQKGRRRGR